MGSESHYNNNRPVLRGGNSGEQNGTNQLEITNTFKKRTGLGARKGKMQQTQATSSAASNQPVKHFRQ